MHAVAEERYAVRNAVGRYQGTGARKERDEGVGDLHLAERIYVSDVVSRMLLGGVRSCRYLGIYLGFGS